MATNATITEKQVRAWCDAKSFERGREYYQDGAIFNARRQGGTLKASCAGSRGGAYRLEVTLGENGKSIRSADCSCPVASGCCKHIAALLLTWIHGPEEFVEAEAVDAALEKRSKEELVA